MGAFWHRAVSVKSPSNWFHLHLYLERLFFFIINAIPPPQIQITEKWLDNYELNDESVVIIITCVSILYNACTWDRNIWKYIFYYYSVISWVEMSRIQVSL